MGFLQWLRTWVLIAHERTFMINETSDSPFPASGMASGSSPLGGSTAAAGTAAEGVASQAHATVHRMARAAHEAVDRLEQTLGSGSERVMDLQQEYGDRAREQVRSNPLAAVAVAFGVGVLLSRLILR
jgi:ElaB/YqjD/DUF883 family membrane-anchored ribosome-binding protein